MKNFWKKYSKILIFIISLPILAYIFLLSFFVLTPLIIEAKFYSEVKEVPEIKVKSFSIFEGVGFAKIDILGKGEVALMYGIKGLGEIRRIDRFDTSFQCHDYSYLWIRYLNFRKDSYFFKNMSTVFPFRINNLKDLVNNYDGVVKVLETFPWDGQKDVKFSFPIQDKNGKTATCYLKKEGIFSWPN